MTEHTQEEIRTMFVWGGIGGALPILARVVGGLSANFDLPNFSIVGVALAIILCTIIGAVVARAFNEKTLKQSLFAGIAAPAMVMSIYSGAATGKSTTVSDSATIQQQFIPPAKSDKGTFLISRAFAQEDSTKNKPIVAPAFVGNSNAVAKTVALKAMVVGSARVNGHVKILDDRGREVGSFYTTGEIVEFNLNLPVYSEGLTFQSESGVKQHVILPDSDKVDLWVTIAPRKSVASDFLWALGGERTLPVGSLTVEAVPNKK
jgi:hypothetical protein